MKTIIEIETPLSEGGPWTARLDGVVTYGWSRVEAVVAVLHAATQVEEQRRIGKPEKCSECGATLRPSTRRPRLVCSKPCAKARRQRFGHAVRALVETEADRAALDDFNQFAKYQEQA